MENTHDIKKPLPTLSPSVLRPETLKKCKRNMGLLSLALILLMGQFVFSLVWLEMGLGKTFLGNAQIQPQKLRYIEYAQSPTLVTHFQDAPNEHPIVAQDVESIESMEPHDSKDQRLDFRPVFHSKDKLYLSAQMNDTEVLEIGKVQQVVTDLEAELFLQRRIEIVEDENAPSSKHVTLFSLDDQICEATLDEPFAVVRAITEHTDHIDPDAMWNDMAPDKILAWTLRFEDKHCLNAVWGRLSTEQSAPRTSAFDEVFVGEKNEILSAITETPEYKLLQKQFEVETHSYSQWHEEPDTWLSVKKLAADSNVFFFGIEAPGCGEFGGALFGIWNSKTDEGAFFDDNYQGVDLVRAIDLNHDGSWEWVGTSRHYELLLFQESSENDIKELESSPLTYSVCHC